jgi:hypothetical protein
VHTSADQHKAHGAPGVDQPSNPGSGRSADEPLLGWGDRERVQGWFRALCQSMPFLTSSLTL